MEEKYQESKKKQIEEQKIGFDLIQNEKNNKI